MRKDVAHLSYDAVRCNHRHIRLEAVAGALINIKNLRSVAAAGAVSLRGKGGIDVLLLEAEQSLETLALAGVFKQCGLLKPQPAYGLLEILILPAHAHQVEIVGPRTHNAEVDPVDEPLRRRDDCIGPKPNQPHAARIRRVKTVTPAARTAHLHRQPGDLRHQDGQQHHEVPIAGEKRFHKNQRTVVSDQWSVTDWCRNRHSVFRNRWRWTCKLKPTAKFTIACTMQFFSDH